MNLSMTTWLGRRPMACAAMCVAVLLGSGLLSMHAARGQEVDGQSRAGDTSTSAATRPAEERPLAKPRGFDRRGMRRDGQAGVQDESLWQMLQEFYPERVSQLKALRERDPRRFAQIEREMRPRLRELRQARAENPRLAELMLQQHHNEMAIHDWQGRYFAANEQDRQGLLEEGRRLAETRVSLRQQREEIRIEMLEKRLQDLKAALIARESQKNSIVDQELEAICDPSAARGGKYPLRRSKSDPVAPPPTE